MVCCGFSMAFSLPFLVFIFLCDLCARYGKHLHVTRMQLWGQNVIYFNGFMTAVDQQHSFSANFAHILCITIRFAWNSQEFHRLFMREPCTNVEFIYLPLLTEPMERKCVLSFIFVGKMDNRKKVENFFFCSRMKCQKFYQFRCIVWRMSAHWAWNVIVELN